MTALLRMISVIIILISPAALTATWLTCGIPRGADNWAACVAIHLVALLIVAVGVLLWKLPDLVKTMEGRR